MSNSATKQVKKEMDNQNDKSNVGNDLKNESSETGNKLDQLNQKVETYQEKVLDNVSNVVEKVRRNSDAAQEFLSGKAELFNEYANSIKDFDFEQTKEKVIKSVRKNPELSLAVAGVVGLLIGFLVGKKSA